jgi:WD40 repeat protein
VRLHGLSGLVHSARYSRDGKRIVTAGADRTVRIWNGHTGGQLLVIHGAAPFSAAAFSPDGSRAAAASADGKVRIYDVSDSRQLLVLRGHGGPVNDVDFSPDGKLIVTASDDKTARV